MKPTNAAFPVPGGLVHEFGMDIRTYVATQLLQGILARSTDQLRQNKHLVAEALIMTDLLLEALECPSQTS